jgi:molecular chaperone DnaK (HSP70)
MVAQIGESTSPDDVEQYAIGISFGNSNSSIAHLSGVR